jgi:hypothetical protein
MKAGALAMVVGDAVALGAEAEGEELALHDLGLAHVVRL